MDEDRALVFRGWHERGFCRIAISPASRTAAECLAPILYVRDFKKAMACYTEKQLFHRLLDWADSPDFGAVRLGKVDMIICQGSPRCWRIWRNAGHDPR